MLHYHHTIDEYEGRVLQFHALLNSTLDGNNWSTSSSGRFTPNETALGTHRSGGWMGSRTGLGV